MVIDIFLYIYSINFFITPITYNLSGSKFNYLLCMRDHCVKLLEI